MSQYTSTTTDIRRFGYYTPKLTETMDFVVHNQVINEDVLSEFHVIISVIFDLQPIIFAFNVVERNYRELVDLIQEHRSQLNNSLGTKTEPTSTIMDGLVLTHQKISNFLSSTSAFLSQTETQLRRVHGKDSPELNKWNKTRKNLHMHSFPYRFLYELRNFAQHCSLPFSSLNITGERASENAPMFFRINLMILRDGLLGVGYDWKESVKAEIMRQPPEFDLLPLIPDYFHILRYLCLDAVQLQSLQIAKCASYFDTIHRIFKIPVDAVPVIYIGESSSKGIPPSRLEIIPMVQFEYLLREYNQLLNACETSKNQER